MSRIERAAGGVVVRVRERGLEALLIDDAYGRVTFPKGHVEPGETWEQAALREIVEETGIEARILAPLGRVEYPIERDGTTIRKQVRFFLLEEIDEGDEPVFQAEEIRGAYFLPWEEAQKRHAEDGYANWSWVLDKAQLLWQWHEEKWEQHWRGLESHDGGALDTAWLNVRPLIEQTRAAVLAELSVVAPDIYQQWQDGGTFTLPKTVDNLTESLRGAIEHTLLKAEASQLDVENLCAEARQNRFKAVCVNPQHVAVTKHMLEETAVISCTVVGFPLGAADVTALESETSAVIAAGATEVDMVIPVGSMREDDIWTVFNAVHRVCTVAHAQSGVHVKVILEAHYLTYAQLAMASVVSICAGADFIKTSTGFAPTGARVADVALMALLAGENRGVKAAGGIRARTDALQYLRYGAARIGTSSGVALLRQ